MAQLKVDAEPAEVGFDPDRLQRVDAHFRSLRRRRPARRLDDRGRPARPGGAALRHHGLADLEADRPVADDTLWRIYSMTKPITSVAALMLYERGALELTDPVSRFIPAFADARVYRAGSALAPATVPGRSSRSGSGTCSPTPPG